MTGVQTMSAKPPSMQSVIFLCTYAAIFIAGRVLGISPGYALDDYVTTLHGSNELNAQLLSQGRFTFASFNTLISTAGLQQTDFIGIGFALLLTCSALFSWQMFESAMRRTAWPWVLLIAALLASYPYLTEYLTFRQSLLPMGLMFGFSYLSLHSYILAVQARGRQRLLSIAAAITLGALAIGMNQLAISFLCIAALFWFMTANDTWTIQSLWGAIRNTAVFGILLMLGYVLTLLAAKALFNAWDSSDRATLLSIGDIPERLSQITLLLRQTYFTSEQLIPLVTKGGVMLALLGLAILCIAERRFMRLVGAILFAVIGTIMALLPVAVGSVWWPVPRTLIALPLVIVGCLALLMPARHTRFAFIPQILASVSVVLFCGLNYSILLDQQRLNRWDMETSRSIASAVATSYPDNKKPIILHGASWTYPVAPNMAIGDMNISALSVDWSADALMEEAAGKVMEVRLADPGLTTAHCGGRARFPASGSIYETPDALHICL